MKPLLAILACILSGNVLGTEVVVHSPETAQTFSHHSIVWRQLRRPSGSGALVASITFSNEDWAGRDEPRRDERFDFSFPGITFDETIGAFFARDPAGRKVPVASIQPALIGKQIRLLPGARIEIRSSSGKIHVRLSASSESRERPEWAERGG